MHENFIIIGWMQLVILKTTLIKTGQLDNE